MKLARFLLPALLALAPALAHAGDPETKFTRLTEGGEGAKLDTAFASYKHPDSDVEIVLYGVIHIADKSYYKLVQKDLDGCDVVLFEGVTPPKEGSEIKPDENMQSIGELQATMSKLLGLEFQKDGIDYKRKNLVHADMTYEELFKATDGDPSKALPGGGMLADPKVMKQLKPMMKMLKGMAGMLPAGMKNNLKTMMAKQLANADMSALPGGENVQKILIGERNKVALKVLDKQLEKTKKGKIAIFYGAAHMKDFHEKLVERGWTQKKVTWRTAWNVGEEDESDGDEKSEPKDEDEHESKPAPKSRPRESTPGAPNKRWF